MQFYSRNEAINRINKLAGAGKAFLFIIDYKQECSFIEKVDDIDSSELLYNLNGFTNCTSVVAPLRYPIIWQPQPISLSQYKRSFDIIRKNILSGNSFLTNLTCMTPVNTNLGLKDIFYHSRLIQTLVERDFCRFFSRNIYSYRKWKNQFLSNERNNRCNFTFCHKITDGG